MRTRNVLRAWLVAILSVTAAPAARGASLQQVSNWTGGVANLPSDVLMYVYVPDKVVANPPVLTLIHSCDSNASIVLGQAGGLKSAADKYGFIIVAPQSNPSSLRCWTTDSTQVWTRDKGGDSNAIKQMVVYALSKYQANADRVYVTGCSSGAMMTELLLGLYPDIFKAGASFAGMPAGCHGPNDNAANATGYNGTCAGGPVNYTPQQWGDLVRAMYPGYTGHRPRLQLFHGSADSIISFSNMAESASQYINLLNLSTNPTKTNTGLTLGTHQGTEQQWNDACGYLVLDAFDSIGGDHGPSDDLFDPTYVVPFLGLDQTGAVDPQIAKCGAGTGGAGGTAGSPGSGGAAGAAGQKGGAGGGGGSKNGGAGGASGGAGGSVATGGASGTSGAGGSSATGAGGSGTGDALASGGASGTGGASSSGGSPGSGGGSGTGTGGGSATVTGGEPGAGGAAGTGGAVSGGCNCAVAGRDAGSGGYLDGCVAVAVALAAAIARRRRVRSSVNGGRGARYPAQ